ncbi:hypothetical protein H0G72_01425 [Liberibacter sp. Z1]|nr:hypothetical protein [Candidatus Liberibacter sp.]
MVPVLGFSHGLNIHFKLIAPQEKIDVIMIILQEPRGCYMYPVHSRRESSPSLIAVHQNPSRQSFCSGIILFL